MHVSAPNFDICVTLSVGVKHATDCSNAQASGKRTQACTTLSVNRWENCANVSLASIWTDSLFQTWFFFSFTVLFMWQERDTDGKMLTDLSFLCLPTTWMPGMHAGPSAICCVNSHGKSSSPAWFSHTSLLPFARVPHSILTL